jgi:cytochrome c peroxidase
MVDVFRIGLVVAALAVSAACIPDEPGIDDEPREGGGTDFVPLEQLGLEGFEPIPPAPEVRPSLVALGEALAYDRILSGNRDVSCMTCHHPRFATADERVLPAGVGADGLGIQRSPDAMIPRNAPPLFNLHAMPNMFWDGRVEVVGGTLRTPAGPQLTPRMRQVFEFGVVSAQAMFPVTSREEMRGLDDANELSALDDDDFQGIWEGLMARLGAIPEYVMLFELAYPGTDFEDMTFAHAANAIAGFEIAAFESRTSPFERFLQGDPTAMTDAEQDGARAFVDANCTECHRGPGLADFAFHNTGLAQLGPGKGHGPTGQEDWGRGGVVNNRGARFAFRTPPLTNVGLTGPWGHAGQFADLGDVVRHYDNPEQGLRDYVVQANVDDPEFFDERFAGSDGAILASIDNDTDARGRPDIGAILTFLNALEDPLVQLYIEDIPESVPSGLPVDR